MEQVTLDMHVADIVSKLPESSDLFRELRIDFCCGGKIPLKEAAANRQIDEHVLMDQLNKLQEKHTVFQEDQPTALDPKSLIVYIQSHYHEKLREELPALTPFVTKLAKVHGEKYSYIYRLQELYRTLKNELLEHTEDEDHVVFPLIVRYLDKPSLETSEQLKARLFELEEEHEAAGNALKEMRDITNGFQPPEDACNTHRLVLQRLENLESDTFQHIHLENNVLFEQMKELI